MDKYDVVLLRLTSKYNNQGERPRLSIQPLDWMFRSSIEEERFGKIPYVAKLERLTEEGFIAKSFEPGSYSGYYITEKGNEYLSKQ